MFRNDGVAQLDTYNYINWNSHNQDGYNQKANGGINSNNSKLFAFARDNRRQPDLELAGTALAKSPLRHLLNNSPKGNIATVKKSPAPVKKQVSPVTRKSRLEILITEWDLDEVKNGNGQPVSQTMYPKFLTPTATLKQKINEAGNYVATTEPPARHSVTPLNLAYQSGKLDQISEAATPKVQEWEKVSEKSQGYVTPTKSINKFPDFHDYATPMDSKSFRNHMRSDYGLDRMISEALDRSRAIILKNEQLELSQSISGIHTPKSVRKIISQSHSPKQSETGFSQRMTWQQYNTCLLYTSPSPRDS
eukprot:TRINITY_DN327_c0_g1_i2.p1 TRINITY_DN327_c0_g1~~TRINITY_DN327_c0_g1_i2.p1  ORF type:complete len:306 (-),score=36.49 TRINITY_DN327_c0_g1_i2:26-943(-)